MSPHVYMFVKIIYRNGSAVIKAAVKVIGSTRIICSNICKFHCDMPDLSFDLSVLAPVGNHSSWTGLKSKLNKDMKPNMPNIYRHAKILDYF